MKFVLANIANNDSFYQPLQQSFWDEKWLNAWEGSIQNRTTQIWSNKVGHASTLNEEGNTWRHNTRQYWDQEPFSQHFVFFVAYELDKKAGVFVIGRTFNVV